MPDPVNLPLTQSIKAHGKDVTALTLRPMRTGDLRRHGYPFIQQRSGDGVQNIWAMGPICALIAELAQIPVSSVDMMSPDDLAVAVGVLTDFLTGTTPQTSLPALGASPDSTAAAPATSST